MQFLWRRSISAVIVWTLSWAIICYSSSSLSKWSFLLRSSRISSRMDAFLSLSACKTLSLPIASVRYWSVDVMRFLQSMLLSRWPITSTWRLLFILSVASSESISRCMFWTSFSVILYCWINSPRSLLTLSSSWRTRLSLRWRDSLSLTSWFKYSWVDTLLGSIEAPKLYWRVGLPDLFLSGLEGLFYLWGTSCGCSLVGGVLSLNFESASSTPLPLREFIDPKFGTKLFLFGLGYLSLRGLFDLRL